MDKIKGLALDIDETLSNTNYYWVTTLSEKFGNPDNLTPEEIVKTYRYTQHVPFWQTPEALAWMEDARNRSEMQEELPLIADANHVVKALAKRISIAAYITARPECVRAGTKRWLDAHDFPEAPIVMRPNEQSYTNGNLWKAGVLHKSYPDVWGIIDDNPGLIEMLPDSYNGTVFLYDHPHIDSSIINVVSVPMWSDVLEAVLADKHVAV